MCIFICSANENKNSIFEFKEKIGKNGIYMQGKNVAIAVVSVVILVSLGWILWSGRKKRDGFEGARDPYAMYGGEVGYFRSL